MTDIKCTENTADIARRLGCLECLGRLSWMPWESLGISEIAWATNVHFLTLTHELMIRLAELSVGCVYYTYRALRYDLMRDYPSEGIPLYLDPYYTLSDGRWCHRVSYSAYLSVVQYYLANLGTTMESQVRSFRLLPVSLCLSPVDPWLAGIYRLLSPSPSASLCAAPPLSFPLSLPGFGTH